MEAIKEIDYCNPNIAGNNNLRVFAKYDDENGKSLNDILKEILKKSLVKESEEIL